MTRKPRKESAPVFKEYIQGQGLLFPPNLDEMVPQDHPVRVVDRIIEELDLTPLYHTYKGGGRSSYHPKMLLKLVVFAYTQKIYSSRQIAKAARENIHFMWLTGSQRPDFRTINRFRSIRLKRTVDELFYSVVAILERLGMISLEDYFLDGTKIEANANKYTFIWRKNTVRYKADLARKVKALLIEIDEINEEENRLYGDDDFKESADDPELTSRLIEEVVEELNEILKEEPENKDVKKAVKTLEKEYLPRMKKYEEQEKLLGDRNSYSRTDPDATFMRMKDDHMRNGQLKPGYNVQIGTENQIIVGYSVHQRPTDTDCMGAHLEGVREHLKEFPDRVIADAGYGSEENYVFLDKNKIDSYVKFPSFHWEQKKRFRTNPFRRENFPYDIKSDSYLCSQGRRLVLKGSFSGFSKTGYEYPAFRYESESCVGCRETEACGKKGEENRVFVVRPLLEYYRAEMRTRLKSVEGKRYRSLRPVEVESVFGQIKWNRGFTRFLLRGLENVKTEWGLLCMAHNMLKVPIEAFS